MLEKYGDLFQLPSNGNWRGNKAVFPCTLSSRLLMLSRFFRPIYIIPCFDVNLFQARVQQLLARRAHRCRLQESPKFMSSCRFMAQLCRQTLIWRLCVFVPASAACSIWPWRWGSKKSVFQLKYETSSRVWQPSCASEHLGCILTVLNIRGIDSGIRCTPLPHPAAKSRDFSEMRIIRFGFMMKSLVRRACFPAQQPKLS